MTIPAAKVGETDTISASVAPRSKVAGTLACLNPDFDAIFFSLMNVAVFRVGLAQLFGSYAY